MIEIIPAIDLIDGKCVRLLHGDFDQKTVYSDNPLATAKRFEDAGVRRLHLVDLDGARNGRVVNHAILRQIAQQTNLLIDFSGGIRTEKDAATAFEFGAHQIACGSIAVKNKPLFESWLKKHGAEKFILGADVIDEKIAVSAWQDQTEINVFDYVASYQNLGLRDVLCTDVSKDGALQGPAFTLYKKLLREFPRMNFIASGGVSSMDDVEALGSIGVRSVIVGRAIYEKKISFDELKRRQRQC